MAKLLQIVMICHNRPLCSTITLESILNSLKCSGYTSNLFDIYVYDDASEKKNKKQLQELVLKHTVKVKITYTDMVQNRGKVLIKNDHLQKYFDYQYTLFVDNDVLFRKNAFKVLFSAFGNLSDNSISVIGEGYCGTSKFIIPTNIGNIYEITDTGTMGSAIHFGLTALFKQLGYKQDESDWQWYPRARKEAGVQFYIVAKPKPVYHIPNLLFDNKMCTLKDVSGRLRSWQGIQKGKSCGDLSQTEFNWLKGLYFDN